MRNIGLHLRIATKLSALLEKAQEVQSPIVQCFFIPQGSPTYVTLDDEEIALCLKKRDSFKELYLHASYWVNLAGRHNNGWKSFHRELELAKKLAFTHIIIHPGSATGCVTKDEGIECLARALNKILSEEHEIKIVLENTAHANKTVGGDIADFAKLLTFLDYPEKVSFCLDSAHAYSYGYPFSTVADAENFVEEVDRLLGTQRVPLLHLNDAAESCGSRIDKHEVPGKGQIGKEALKAFMNHPKLSHTSVILEMPILDEEQERAVLKEVQGWAFADKVSC